MPVRGMCILRMRQGLARKGRVAAHVPLYAEAPPATHGQEAVLRAFLTFAS